MPDRAQQVLVERLTSWDLIRERLARYPAIASAFSLELLERHRTTPPYFCHYMGWRLGTWGPAAEASIQRLEELLRLAESLPQWTHERGLLESPEFSDFWALMWQLQVAEHLTTVGQNVAWSRGGPDLRADVAGERLFVECYVYRKSYGLMEFLFEVFAHLGTDIKFERDFFLQFSLPPNRETEAFLDRTFAPFLDEGTLRDARARAKESWPVPVSLPASTLVIYVTDEDDGELDHYDPDAVPQINGDPMEYLVVALKEAIGAKAKKNNLGAFRPNLLAVNYLLSTEMSAADYLRGVQNARVELTPNLDGFAIASLGIDARLNRDRLLLLRGRATASPAHQAVSHPIDRPC